MCVCGGMDWSAQTYSSAEPPLNIIKKTIATMNLIAWIQPAAEDRIYESHKKQKEHTKHIYNNKQPTTTPHSEQPSIKWRGIAAKANA